MVLSNDRPRVLSIEDDATDDDDDDWFLGEDPSCTTTASIARRRRIRVDPDLGEKLKPYQRDGVEFLWRNCFSDFNDFATGDPTRIGGCILAHYMGLGKSLTTITVLHTALCCDSMTVPAAAAADPSSSSSGMAKKKRRTRKPQKPKPLLRTVLLVAPANTLTNWVDEVKKWARDLDRTLPITNLGAATVGSRSECIREWQKNTGGILMLSDSMFLRVVKDIQPDVLVLDEAHTMLKQSGNKGFQRLLDIQTPRRILLTGTPLQNNCTEYYRMVEYIRPGVIGVKNEVLFEKIYRKPIERGLPSDAPDRAKLKSIELQRELNKKLEPYIDRKGPDVLRKFLPPIYDNLLELDQSQMQKRLAKRLKMKKKKNNFLSFYAKLSPVLNHPGTLKVDQAKRRKKIAWKSEDSVKKEWFMENLLTKKQFKTLHEPKTSPKMVILAHIVAYASQKDDKILIYSKDLRTLDLVEWFLGERDWKKHVDLSSFDEELGGWEKNKDFVRIDGGVDSSRRGDLVKKFNYSSTMKAFLISSLAGGIGINLFSASVVVMMDNHFNPSVSNQCISRAHRLGQKKPVHCFRLAMEDTIETQTYAKSVNKEGVAMQVVDGKFSENIFKEEELMYSLEPKIIMTCDLCQKKRLLLIDLPKDDGLWKCEMNSDPRFNSCGKPVQKGLEKIRRGPLPIRDNPFLEYVTGITTKRRKTTLVVDYIPVQITHETDLCCEEAIARLKKKIDGVPRPKMATKRAEEIHYVSMQLNDLANTKGKTEKGSSQDALAKLNARIRKSPPSGKEKEPKAASGDRKKKRAEISITNSGIPAPSNNFDIISISSDSDNDPDQPPPCKKVSRRGINKKDVVRGGPAKKLLAMGISKTIGCGEIIRIMNNEDSAHESRPNKTNGNAGDRPNVTQLEESQFSHRVTWADQHGHKLARYKCINEKDSKVTKSHHL